MKKLSWLIVVSLLLMSACARPPERPVVVEEPVFEEPVVKEPVVEEPIVEGETPVLQVVSWQEVSGWQQDDPSLALGAFLKSCSSLRWRPQWQTTCQEAAAMEHAGEGEVRTRIRGARAH